MGVTIRQHPRQTADIEQLPQSIAHCHPFGLNTVNGQRLGDDVADFHARIERAVGVLENRLHSSAKLLGGLFIEAMHVFAAESNLTVGGCLQLKNATTNRSFAATGLPHQTQRLALANGQAHAVDRFYLSDGAFEDDPLGYGKVFLEIRDLEKYIVSVARKVG